jgi:hypothetical protein
MPLLFSDRPSGALAPNGRSAPISSAPAQLRNWTGSSERPVAYARQSGDLIVPACEHSAQKGKNIAPAPLQGWHALLRAFGMQRGSPGMADMPEGKRSPWRKSSFSSDTANCVEFAPGSDGVGLRDSKDPDGPSLWFTVDSWRDFVATVVVDGFDTPGSRA